MYLLSKIPQECNGNIGHSPPFTEEARHSPHPLRRHQVLPSLPLAPERNVWPYRCWKRWSRKWKSWRSPWLPWVDTPKNMGVSENRGTPKSSILIGFSIINHPFWGTHIFGNTHTDLDVSREPTEVRENLQGLLPSNCLSPIPRKRLYLGLWSFFGGSIQHPSTLVVFSNGGFLKWWYPKMDGL